MNHGSGSGDIIFEGQHFTTAGITKLPIDYIFEKIYYGSASAHCSHNIP